MESLKAVDVEYETLRADVAAEMEASGLTQATVAREAGISSSQAGGFIHNNYTGDMAAAAGRLEKWLQSRKRRASLDQMLPEQRGWIQTPTAKRILSNLLYSHHTGTIGVVYGGAGLGKTQTARHYSEQARNIWLVTMTPSSAKLGGCLRRLARALGIKSPSIWPEVLETQIIDALTATRGLLIVDEAQHETIESLESLRSIQEASGVGMVLMGNSSVYARLTGGSRQAHFAQLFSRIARRTALARATEADAEAMAEAWGVTGADERRFLVTLATKREEALRGVANTLRQAATYAGPGGPITLAHLKTAWKELAEDA